MRNRGDTDIDEASIAENLPEQEILIQSVCETMVPKLVAEDIPLLFSLLNDVFPNVNYTRAEMKGIVSIIIYPSRVLGCASISTSSAPFLSFFFFFFQD